MLCCAVAVAVAVAVVCCAVICCAMAVAVLWLWLCCGVCMMYVCILPLISHLLHHLSSFACCDRYECVEIEVNLPTLPSDLENAPSVYMMVYHEGTVDHTLLGRCEVLADHIDRHPNRLYRYRLRYESQLFADAKREEPKDTDPYVLASFELFRPGQYVPTALQCTAMHCNLQCNAMHYTA
jgi:hypothetical protein